MWPILVEGTWPFKCRGSRERRGSSVLLAIRDRRKIKRKTVTVFIYGSLWVQYHPNKSRNSHGFLRWQVRVSFFTAALVACWRRGDVFVGVSDSVLLAISRCGEPPGKCWGRESVVPNHGTTLSWSPGIRTRVTSTEEEVQEFPLNSIVPALFAVYRICTRLYAFSFFYNFVVLF